MVRCFVDYSVMTTSCHISTPEGILLRLSPDKYHVIKCVGVWVDHLIREAV